MSEDGKILGKETKAEVAKKASPQTRVVTTPTPVRTSTPVGPSVPRPAPQAETKSTQPPVNVSPTPKPVAQPTPVAAPAKTDEGPENPDEVIA